LRDKHGLLVHPDTIHSFVKVRSKCGPKYLKIAPQFLSEKGTPEQGLGRTPKSGEKKTSNGGTVGANPPKSYPVVNPNQL